MPLRVLYVEDTESDANRLRNALESGNLDKPVWSKVHLDIISHPSALPDALSGHYDVVLADVYYQPEGTTPPVKETDHLDEIIHAVKKWDKQSLYGFPTPVIAYTSRGAPTLKKCLERREALYDIWDKASAGPEYATWRFQGFATELQRHRPDATIQKLIASIPHECCPPWHSHMLDLIKKYGEGKTEHEQIKKCRDSLQSILNDVYPKRSVALMALWDVLVESEPLLRAVAPKLRGIARHSINVFWVGYWLINHPSLQDNMSSHWKQMRDSRANMPELKAVNSIEGLNAVWLLTSLFHDAGKFHEYGKTITDASGKLFSKFGSLKMGMPSWAAGETNALPNAIEQTLFNLAKTNHDPMANALRNYIENRSTQEKPDHGAVSAAYLLSIGGSDATGLFNQYAGEAARAVLLHSCLPSVFDTHPPDKRDSCPQISWQQDPMASLLLFCDQIQTWDRHDTTKEINDYPDRAELSYLHVETEATTSKPRIKGCINYIAPSRVDMYPQLREDIKSSLNKVILEKPKDTLLHLLPEGHWPFSVHLDCALSGDKLSIDMDFE